MMARIDELWIGASPHGARILRRAVHCVVVAIGARELAQRVARGHDLLEQAAQRARHRHFLDDDLFRSSSAQVDDAGDRRPDPALFGRLVFVRDRVDDDGRRAGRSFWS